MCLIILSVIIKVSLTLIILYLCLFLIFMSDVKMVIKSLILLKLYFKEHLEKLRDEFCLSSD